MENSFYIDLLKRSKNGVSKRFYTATLLAKCKKSYFENFIFLLYIYFYVNSVISLFLINKKSIIMITIATG